MLRVGLWSLGIILCAVGLALLWQNLTGTAAALSLLRFWGVIPLLLGVEMLLAGRQGAATGVRGQAPRIGLHPGAVAGLGLLVLLALLFNLANALAPWDVEFDAGGVGYPHQNVTEFSETLTLPQGVSEVSLSVSPGQWSIIGAETDEVRVEVSLSLRAVSAAWAARAGEEARIVLSPEESRLSLELDVPGYQSGFSRPSVRPIARVQIVVPAHLDVIARGSTGDLIIGDLSSRVEVTTGTGDIDIRRVGGSVTLTTSTGMVRVEDIGGRAEIRTSTGDVSVFGVAGSLGVRTNTGKVQATGPRGPVDIKTSTGSCSVSASTPVAGDWSVTTATASISVSFPRESSVRVSAETGTGSITNTLGFIVSGSTRRTMSGTLGDGAYDVRLETGTAGIYVDGTD